MKRHDNRRMDELRPLSISYGIYGYAPGSVLFSMGNTKILCSVTMQSGVPSFLRGKGKGWLTAEYALLPASTHTRTTREISVMKRQSRSIEISRIISRALRTVVNLDLIGERTIMVDCDVLQADGGTRAASITAAYAALLMAQEKWLSDKTIAQPLLTDGIAAVAVGVLEHDQLVLDPDYQEDCTGHADINVIMTLSGKLIELQGGAEKEPIDWQLISQIGVLSKKGIDTLSGFLTLNPPSSRSIQKNTEKRKNPLFSLGNRIGPQTLAS